VQVQLPSQAHSHKFPPSLGDRRTGETCRKHKPNNQSKPQKLHISLLYSTSLPPTWKTKGTGGIKKEKKKKA